MKTDKINTDLFELNSPHYKILKLMSKLLGHVNLIGATKRHLICMTEQYPRTLKWQEEKQQPR